MVSEPDPLASLRSALRDLVRWWRAARVRGIVIGGVAASILGRPRLTRDIDGLVILDAARWEQFAALAGRFGFAARIPEAIEFARESRVPLLRHQWSEIDVDISFSVLPFEDEAVARKMSKRVGRLRIPLPTPEDLIVLKAVAHRPRDLADIEGILAATADLNLRHVRRWVREFADVLGSPEILSDLERLLRRAQRQRRRE
jgi:hypothetical protein